MALHTVRRNCISSSPPSPSAILLRGLFAAPQEKSENPSVFSSVFQCLLSLSLSQCVCVGVLEDSMSPVALTVE